MFICVFFCKEQIITEEKIIEKSPLTEQLEYYFSSKNLSRDKYLYSILKANENTIPLFTFMDFPKVMVHTNDINVSVPNKAWCFS